MKNKFIIVVFVLLLLASSTMFFMPSDIDSFKNENREQASIPEFSKESFFSGRFAKSFDAFVNDNISFRSELISTSHILTDNKGITPPDGKIVYTNKDIGTQTVKKACMLIVKDKMMEVFTKNPDSERKYAEAINKIAESIDADTNIYSMLVPTQLEFSEKVYKNIQTSQKKTIEEIDYMLSEKVTPVDVYSALEHHTDEYIYFRTDHHWTMLGAYYGYRAFMNTKGEVPVDNNSFQKNSVSGMLGYLYKQYPNEDIKRKPDTLEWYDTETPNDIKVSMQSIENGKIKDYTSPMFDKTRNDYSFFFSADHPYVLITNKKIKDKKTLLVIKDSFASDFVPWCINDYSDIIMIDPRSYKGNLKDVLANNKIDDVVILNYIFTTSFEDYCNLMKNMVK